jgi:hypothetical protein
MPICALLMYDKYERATLKAEGSRKLGVCGNRTAIHFGFHAQMYCIKDVQMEFVSSGTFCHGFG